MDEPGGTSQALWEWDLWKGNNQIGGKTGTSSDYVDGWYMGVTKDLVTGVWVGCDERSVHFKTSETGEGSRTALPIFAKFMEKVYEDPSLGIKFGPFPKSGVKISREYQCVTPRYERDTFAVDSMFLDSLIVPESTPDTSFTPPPVQINPSPQKEQENRSSQQPANKPPVIPRNEPVSEENKTRKQIRDERRQNNSKQNN